MACYSPIPTWSDLSTGEWVFSYSPTRELSPQFQTGCRQCDGCRRGLAAEKALRCMHESQFHESCCFLTLTFDDEHFPAGQAELERAVVLFVKRMRKGFPSLLTFGCAELGETTQRPHAHVLVFGRDFSRDEPMARGHAGELCYRSHELDALWGLGHASVGDLNQRTAGYVSRYTMKRRSINDALGEFVPVPHPITGEPIPFRPARSIAVSKSLGRRWFVKYGEQVIRQGAVILAGGVRVPIPSYYVKLAKDLFPGVGADAQCEAIERAEADAWNRTPDRLAVREEVSAAKTRTLVRGGV